jgi:hypothetical protein
MSIRVQKNRIYYVNCNSNIEEETSFVHAGTTFAALYFETRNSWTKGLFDNRKYHGSIPNIERLGIINSTPSPVPIYRDPINSGRPRYRIVRYVFSPLHFNLSAIVFMFHRRVPSSNPLELLVEILKRRSPTEHSYKLEFMQRFEVRWNWDYYLRFLVSKERHIFDFFLSAGSRRNADFLYK